jgi:acyl-CoA oxidase
LPGHGRELEPLLPLVLSVWTDGVLSPAELDALESHVDRQGWLNTEDRRTLAAWLDPDGPPTPSELQALERHVRDAGLGSDPAAISSLTDLGLALWRAAGGTEGCWSRPASVDALRALEASLGVLGAEAARRAAGAPAPTAPPPRSPGGIDVPALSRFLERDHHEIRDRTRALLARPEMTIEPGLPLHEYRERVLGAVRHLAERGWGRLGYPTAYGGSDDPAGAIAAFETLALGDLSVVVKFGVQFGLFGGSVLHLGTRRHHAEYLERIGSLDLPGCYAMTETGHGSNVRDLETVAIYDPDTEGLHRQRRTTRPDGDRLRAPPRRRGGPRRPRRARADPGRRGRHAAWRHDRGPGPEDRSERSRQRAHPARSRPRTPGQPARPLRLHR